MSLWNETFDYGTHVVNDSRASVSHSVLCPDGINVWGWTSSSGNCFVAGTLVIAAEYNANGTFVQYVTKNIEDVKVGEVVLAKDQNDPNGALVECVVVDTFVRYNQEVATVTLTNATSEKTLEITGTLEHPFYVEGKGFVALGELEVGDICISPDGSEFTVVDIVIQEERQTVYNFEVEGGHTYYVGLGFDNAVLVHNQYDPTGLVTESGYQQAIGIQDRDQWWQNNKPPKPEINPAVVVISSEALTQARDFAIDRAIEQGIKREWLPAVAGTINKIIGRINFWLSIPSFMYGELDSTEDAWLSEHRQKWLNAQEQEQQENSPPRINGPQ